MTNTADEKPTDNQVSALVFLRRGKAAPKDGPRGRQKSIGVHL